MPMDGLPLGLDLNVFSLFRLTQLAAPHMEEAGGGAVLNISSMAGDNRNPAWRRMARRRRRSITHAQHRLRSRAERYPRQRHRARRDPDGALATGAHAGGRDGDAAAHAARSSRRAADIANAALFLCSRAVGWISGQVLTVSGGGVQEFD